MELKKESSEETWNKVYQCHTKIMRTSSGFRILKIAHRQGGYMQQICQWRVIHFSKEAAPILLSLLVTKIFLKEFIFSSSILRSSSFENIAMYCLLKGFFDFSMFKLISQCTIHFKAPMLLT